MTVEAATVFEPARAPYIVPTREVAVTVEAETVFEPARAPYIVPTREVALTVEAETVFEPARAPYIVPTREVAVTVPTTSRGATGLVVPIPTFPLAPTNSTVVPEVVWALNTLPVPNCLTVSAFAEAALPVNRTWLEFIRVGTPGIP